MLAALVLLTGWGCHPPPEVVFEAVHQLLDDIPERAHDDAPPSCSIAGDIRPALGCLPEFPLGTETGIHVAGAVSVWWAATHLLLSLQAPVPLADDARSLARAG